MFSKLASTPSRKSSTPKLELPLTAQFLSTVKSEGYRLSYAALAIAARTLGEDSSTQIPAQRGAALVKSLPVTLQPFVCRKSGGYGKGVLSKFEQDLPKDLTDRPVITKEAVAEAIEIANAASDEE